MDGMGNGARMVIVVYMLERKTLTGWELSTPSGKSTWQGTKVVMGSLEPKEAQRMVEEMQHAAKGQRYRVAKYARIE